MSNAYVKFWYVQSHSDPNKQYKVSQRADGTYACSCPHWIYRHVQCKHILQVIAGGVAAILVQNPFLVKMLSRLGGWCERIDKGEKVNADFDGIWKEANDQRPFLTPAEWGQLEGEIIATETFWRTHK